MAGRGAPVSVHSLETHQTRGLRFINNFKEKVLSRFLLETQTCHTHGLQRKMLSFENRFHSSPALSSPKRHHLRLSHLAAPKMGHQIRVRLWAHLYGFFPQVIPNWLTPSDRRKKALPVTIDNSPPPSAQCRPRAPRPAGDRPHPRRLPPPRNPRHPRHCQTAGAESKRVPSGRSRAQGNPRGCLPAAGLLARPGEGGARWGGPHRRLLKALAAREARRRCCPCRRDLTLSGCCLRT